MKKVAPKKTAVKKKPVSTKVMAKPVVKSQGPSTALVGALIFSILLLITVLLWRHQMLDGVEDLNSTGFRGAARQQKNALENKVKTEVQEKLQINK